MTRAGAAFEQTLRVGAGEFQNTAGVELTESVRADFPIGLSFTGVASAGVRIESLGAVLLQDAIHAATTTIIARSIDAVAGIDGIEAGRVTLLATHGIGRAAEITA